MYKFQDIVLSVSSILKIVFNLDNVEKTLLCFTYHVFFPVINWLTSGFVYASLSLNSEARGAKNRMQMIIPPQDSHNISVF